MTYTISIASKKAGKVTATSSDGNTLTTSPRGPKKNPAGGERPGLTVDGGKVAQNTKE
jgi:hypothetical protein